MPQLPRQYGRAALKAGNDSFCCSCSSGGSSAALAPEGGSENRGDLIQAVQSPARPSGPSFRDLRSLHASTIMPRLPVLEPASQQQQQQGQVRSYPKRSFVSCICCPVHSLWV